MNTIEHSHSPYLNEIDQKAKHYAKQYQRSEADLLEILRVIQHSKLFLPLGHDSLFSYCTRSLNLSEAQAYAFMTVAKKSLEVPELRDEIRAGRLSLSKAKRIVPVLTKENHKEWIQKAQTLSKFDLEKEVAAVSPYTKSKEMVRAVSKERIALRLEVSDQVHAKLRRVQDVLSSKDHFNASFEDCIGAMADAFLRRFDPLVRRTLRRRVREHRSARPVFKLVS